METLWLARWRRLAERDRGLLVASNMLNLLHDRMGTIESFFPRRTTPQLFVFRRCSAGSAPRLAACQELSDPTPAPSSTLRFLILPLLALFTGADSNLTDAHCFPHLLGLGRVKTKVPSTVLACLAQDG
jgi:hypothetical protein